MSRILTAFIAGAAVGAVLGVLFAPGKGTETRDKIKEEGKKMADALKSKIHEAKDKFEKYAGDM